MLAAACDKISVEYSAASEADKHWRSTAVPGKKEASGNLSPYEGKVLNETMKKTHLRVIMLHEFKLRHSVSEATQNIKMAWGEDSANERAVRRWYQKFRVGDVDLEDKDRSRRPAKCDDGRLKERVEADSRGTVREMGRELQVSRTTISRHLEAIGKVKKLDKARRRHTRSVFRKPKYVVRGHTSSQHTRNCISRVASHESKNSANGSDVLV
ncbi:unnamed protein product [Heligmosomoides polygyrus]|uniref:HTH_48 domain-containing protein n=1 Tax=Heligmosomoides polygyrus TaxID=6339 RepID=A0A183G4F7_HELPZ|nr:unnamed protein product [Heligmosomoides polygyrus]